MNENYVPGAEPVTAPDPAPSSAPVPPQGMVIPADGQGVACSTSLPGVREPVVAPEASLEVEEGTRQFQESFQHSSPFLGADLGNFFIGRIKVH